jgi:hypothetical protein
MANSMVERMRGVVATLLKSERLDELPASRVGPARQSFLAWLMLAEPLQFDDGEKRRSGDSRASRLFGSESLPEDEPAGSGRRASFLSTLFSGELLPADPVHERAPRGRTRMARGAGGADARATNGLSHQGGRVKPEDNHQGKG